MRRGAAALSLLILGCGSDGSAPLAQMPPAPPPRLLILGDSHADKWGEYQAKVGALFPGWQVTISGYPGSASFEVEPGLQRNIDRAGGCQIVVLIVGTNDMLFGKAPQSAAAVQRMEAVVRAQGCHPVTWKIPQIPKNNWTEARDVAPWNAQVEGQLDGYAISLQPGTMQPDGVHISDEGYRQLTIALHSIIGG